MTAARAGQPGQLGRAPIGRGMWTSGQRQANSLHEISYRACFKPHLPAYFIEAHTSPGDLVIDPFLGRGTTALQAHLMGRRAAGSDVNPLCAMLAAPRFDPPALPDIARRLDEIARWADSGAAPGVEDPDGPGRVPLEDLLAFYHPDTLSVLSDMKSWFARRAAGGTFDGVDGWVRMVCLSRLSGHSGGYFSVRTMPPNQAVSAESQRQINAANRQHPSPRDVRRIVLSKSRSLLRSAAPGQMRIGQPEAAPGPPALETAPADDLGYLGDGAADLIVTSPPFLNIVDYRTNNWLRCWFAGIDPASVPISRHSTVKSWTGFMRGALAEMCRVTKPGGRIAVEVGEVAKGEIKLDEAVLDAAEGLPAEPEAVLVNEQSFTKTSNLWGVANNEGGTNTNRIVVFAVGGAAP